MAGWSPTRAAAEAAPAEGAGAAVEAAVEAAVAVEAAPVWAWVPAEGAASEPGPAPAL
ncbi:hypothetical protein [Azospirillum sp. sgz301742]